MIYLYSIIEGFFFTDFFSHSHCNSNTENNINVQDIDIEELRKELKKQGAFI